jgi:hypothetical protein
MMWCDGMVTSFSFSAAVLFSLYIALLKSAPLCLKTSLKCLISMLRLSASYIVLTQFIRLSELHVFAKGDGVTLLVDTEPYG